MCVCEKVNAAMTLVESRTAPENSAAAGVCSRCAAKIMPYFIDNAVASNNQLISENFLTVKGAALFLPHGNGSSPSLAPRITQRRNTHTGDLQQHLQTMFTVLRPEDTIRLAVRLESAYPQCTRYMVVVSTNGRQDTEESVVLGMDFNSSDCQCTVGLVLPLWSDTLIHLDGDGGFSVSTVNRVHIFKPVSVQAMWSALQSLHKACEVARCHNYFPGSLFLTWVSYYQTRVSSEQHCINEWNAMRDVQSHRSDSPVLFTDVPTERERTERLIKTCLREIMMQKDLENVTSKEIRSELEMQMVCNLREFKEFIDNEMIVILGQMDSPTEIFEHVFLGSEWNASNLEELQSSGVRYILNVTREIDNFFPGLFEYHNIRVYDEEATNLLEYWNDTFKFISKAKKAGVKCLVHCKMGVSRSASTVIAYAMKEYGWDLDRAYDHVKERRSVTKPNPSFMKQLEEYQGILLASKQRHNKLWRSHSDSDLSEQQESGNKNPRTLGRSDPHNHQHKPNRSIHSVFQTFSSSQPETEDTRSELSTHSSTENDLCAERSQEDPLHPALPCPRADTVLREQNLTESGSLKVEVTVPITRPHPPPSPHVHVSPHSATEQSLIVPEPNTDHDGLSCNIPAQDDAQPSAVHSLAVSLDTVSSFSETGDTLESSGDLMSVSPSESSTELGYRCSSALESSNSRENRVASSSKPSTDSIDFFSAREKFLGLSRDGQACSLSEVVATPTVNSQSPTLCLEEPSPAAVEGSDPLESCSEATEALSEEQQDGGTELDSVDSEQPPALRPQHQSVMEEQQENEKKDDPSLPEPSITYSMPSCELASEQERESMLSQSSDSSEFQQCCFPPEGTTVTSCSNKAEEHGEETRPLDDDDSGIIPDPSLCTATVNPSLDPSSSSSSLLWLESEVEETTARPHDLHKIQETLRELQAFLYEAGGMEAHFKYTQQLQSIHRSTDSQPRTPALWQRAMEMEARIRQAGLTPPSLMKRSASLAKLDQLELSTHDLNDWDFLSELPSFSSSSSSSSLSSRSHSHSLPNNHDEVHKKQRVLPQNPSEPNRTETCPLTSVCLKHSQRGSTGPPTCTLAPPTDSTHTRQQQHMKAHPIRRARKSADKKKTVAVLYNTM